MAAEISHTYDMVESSCSGLHHVGMGFSYSSFFSNIHRYRRSSWRLPCLKRVRFIYIYRIHIYIPLTLIIFFNYKIFKIAWRQRRRIVARSMTQYNLGMQAGNCDPTNEQTMQTGNSTNDQNALWQRITKELKQLKTFLIVIRVLLVCFIPYSLAVSLHNLVYNCIPV